MTPEDAAAIFERGRTAARSIALLRAHRSVLESGASGRGMPTASPGGGVSDPTARAAMSLVDQGFDEQERALAAEVAEARDLCLGLGMAFARHQEYRIAMELHYIHDMPWKQVASSLDCSVSHALALRATACEYVAQVGPAAAKLGLGRAEA